MVRNSEGRFRLFSLLVGTFAVQSVLSGLHWSVGWYPAFLIQPILAAILPALSFVAFDNLRSGGIDPTRLLPHVMPAAFVAGLVFLWREPLDLVLFAIYFGYGLALLAIAKAGPGALTAARLGDETVAHRALVVLGMIFILTAFVDAMVSLDLVFGEGRRATMILNMASVLWLTVAGYAATVAESSRPASEADAMPTASPWSEPARHAATVEVEPPKDDGIVARVDALMREQHLYRDPDLTLERIARRAGIPARQISAALNRTHGRNVSQVVNEYRVAEARRRLVDTSEPVTSVMLESGFGTKSNFNREFLRVTGMSPSAYRRSNGRTPAAEVPAAETGSPESAS